MGCDYYIVRELEVTYIKDGEERTTWIEVKRMRGYIFDNDSDDDKDDESYLEVTYEPRILYENGEWLCKKQYESLLPPGVTKIVKQERRFWR